MTRGSNPVGYFVHHQGRGHAERAASIANAMAPSRPVTLFCARTDIFPALDNRVQVLQIPSLFEGDGPAFPVLEQAQTPDTMHCAPLGWKGVTKAVGTIARWFDEVDPSLFITDVSAELGQLARIASIPHCAVLQHGDRDDPGHVAAYQSAVALLAPYAEILEQGERPAWMREKTIYAGGPGIDYTRLSSPPEAKRALQVDPGRELVVVVGGGGGTGLPSAPITLGARDDYTSQWITLGKIQTEWHETPPGNLTHLGWVDNPEQWISAADRVVSSCGNTTVHMVAAAGKPWIVVPEWRYFNEQSRKAESLDHAGAAAMAREWPGSAQAWRKMWQAARAIDAQDQAAIVDPDAAVKVADKLEKLIAKIWQQSPEEQKRTAT